jgi:hypothetical protein
MGSSLPGSELLESSLCLEESRHSLGPLGVGGVRVAARQEELGAQLRLYGSLGHAAPWVVSVQVSMPPPTMLTRRPRCLAGQTYRDVGVP